VLPGNRSRGMIERKGIREPLAAETAMLNVHGGASSVRATRNDLVASEVDSVVRAQHVFLATSARRVRISSVSGSLR